MNRELFPLQMEWTEATCFYVAALSETRLALLAGPYRTRAAAESMLPAAQVWALRESGDALAERYEYAIHESQHGRYRSILGEWESRAAIGSTDQDFDAYLERRRAVAIMWCVADVELVRPDLSADECWAVLQAARYNYDPEYGLTWSHIADTAAELFGPPPMEFAA